MNYIKSQLYHFNILSFILICVFVIVIGKMNMKKELKKIHKDIEFEISLLKSQLVTIFNRVNKRDDK